jgi:hypothetical protein
MDPTDPTDQTQPTVAGPAGLPTGTAQPAGVPADGTAADPAGVPPAGTATPQHLDERPARAPASRRLLAFRVLAAVPVLLFLISGTDLLAPWVFVLTPTEPDPDAHRWFFAVAAAADLFALVSFAGLAVRPRLTSLAATIAMSLVVVMVTIVPLQPSFLILLAFLVPAVVAYPYWRDLRGWRQWWAGARRPLVAFAATVCVALLVTSAAALVREIVRDDSVAAANWWSDYAEHSADIALVGLIAVSRAPGSLLLRGLLSAVWVYLGAVAAFVLPDAAGSWGTAGGLVAIAVGVVFGLATARDLRAARAARGAPAGQLPLQRGAPSAT